MSKKYVDLEEDKYEKTQDQLSAQANVHGLGMWNKPGAVMSEDLKDIYGICHDCTNFFYCRREFGEAAALCRKFEDPIKLTPRSRMVECNGHEHRRFLSLAQMMDIAYVIGDQKKVKGFVE